jgi:hypothetical protein
LLLSVMVGINQKVESRRKGTSALAVQKKGEVFTVIHSSTFHMAMAWLGTRGH